MSDPLQDIRQLFDLNLDTFKAIVDGFKAEYESGLNTASAAGLATMIPSYVTTLPTGKEKGTYLALDLGGSTLRVSAVELLGDCNVKVTEIRRDIAPHDPLRTSGATTFFDWIVDTIAELILKIGYDTAHADEPLSLGVCWSFPVDQTSVSAGKILRMGKGFTIEGVEGYDLAALFLEAFQRKNVNVKVTALLNDTVGTLVAHAYTNPDTRVGFIYGTGVNAAYPELVSRMVKLKDQQSSYEEGTTMLVNTEIDIFGSDAYLPLNKFDRQLDANHSQPDFQLYEKMMSGACIGELVRLAALELIEKSQLFSGHCPTQFAVALEFGTSVTSAIEGRLDSSAEARFEHFKEHFTFEDGYTIELNDLEIFTGLCQIVSDRAARLAAAAMASLIEQQDDLINGIGPIVIGVNGSTYEKYPNMHDRILSSLKTWFGPQVSERIQLEVATDGGSIGGALIAMLAEKEEKKKASTKKAIPAKKTLPSTSRAAPVSKPASPSFFGCLFAWLAPLKAKRDHVSDVDETIGIKSQEKI
ncbi:uncharacterized protein EV154DRAFT_492783 [Mucor mucedo]|uniref:uncharacterized protein n=1 Tax=Mucor mucedo TaxID=29922 RepID=UPI00221F73BA|nr:uncharacterized protein EV154DRAFT_492783 [Mucor mucedo]KAI7896247.1 hypothetical protein EV154DRAFT_492783 [Mucor mucedo]